MTSLMNNAGTDLTLIALLAQDAPDEFFAVGAESGLPEVSGHKFMAIDLVDAASHSAATPIETLALLELAILPLRAVTFIAGFKLDLDVQAPLRLQVNPEVLVVFGSSQEILEGDAAVGDEVVGGYSSVVEDSKRETIGRLELFHLEFLVPNGVEGLLLGGALRLVPVVDIDGQVGVDELLLGLLAPHGKGHRVSLLEVRRPQPRRLADLHLDTAREHVVVVSIQRKSFYVAAVRVSHCTFTHT